LSHLLVADLGNKPRESVLDPTGDTAEQIANLALFSNVQLEFYWSGTEYGLPGASDAFTFFGGMGYQRYDDKGSRMYAVAVRPGDVTGSVPEPETLALVAAALLGLVAVRRHGLALEVVRNNLAPVLRHLEAGGLWAACV
jgi:hypothetical protein